VAVFHSLEAVREELNKCMKCGNCQAVCPIYKETRKEVGVARGKIKLVEALLDGETEMSEGLADRLLLCTTCMACNQICPCGVKFDQILLGARAEAVRKKGLHSIKKYAFFALKHNKLFDLGLKVGARFQGVAFKRVSNKGGRSRFPIGLDQKKIIPALATTPLKDQLPEVTTVANPKMKVAYFVGCMTNYCYPDMGRDLVEVLQANNIEVVTPKQQHCCGTPVYVNGDVETAIAMAKSNLDIFEQTGAEALVLNCGSCTGSWKHHYKQLLDQDTTGYKQKAEKWAAKTYDISEFIVKFLKLEQEKLGTVTKKVTYHDPCHLARSQGITKEPRAVLQSIPGVELVEMKNPGRCCGMAGSFSLTFPELSNQILEHKVKDIASTHTAVVATSCPACRMQLSSGVENAGMEHEVVHVVQILAEAYRAKKSSVQKGAAK
jgi:glycolate oxidase iron-sulfur subunit